MKVIAICETCNQRYVCKIVQPLFLNHNLFINHLRAQNKHYSGSKMASGDLVLKSKKGFVEELIYGYLSQRQPRRMMPVMER